MSRIWEKLQREPALLVGLVTAILSLLVSFGIDISDESQAAIVALVIAVGAIIIRQSVTPNVSVGAHQDDLEPPGHMVAGDASPIPNDTPVDVVEQEPLWDEKGHGSATALTVAAVLVIIVCLVWLLERLL